MRWRMAVLPVLLGCSGGPATRGHHWLDLDVAPADLRDAVAARARDAANQGLVPVLYLSASYTIASTELQRMRTAPAMRDALQGIFVIEVAGLSDASPYAHLLHGYWHSFHAINAAGEPGAAALDPMTKNGPCTTGDADECAAWIRPFMQSLRAVRTSALRTRDLAERHAVAEIGYALHQ